MSDSDVGAVFGCGLLIAMILAAYGYFMNIYMLVSMAVAHEPINSMFVLRLAGIPFAPLGIFLGYFS